ncbi:hypothetical protein JK636_19055 [Clostridium sp. YIM B02515]|uniref:Uncharacterized protein n=1 Tax=Clostridium rhizosphaerae TaxID=2803861 RepID=A0ABS1TEK7_9CLOT|nr:hypothetical protein [Clostridium rhizosphaerae]MBL4937809.1 hypothetical protein [Clostridium rhizosphaerae]
MFVDNAVVKKIEGGEVYDKFAIAATLLDVSFKGASCSILEAQIVEGCDGCNLKYLCGRVDEVVKDYREKTTMVTESFSFI